MWRIALRSLLFHRGKTAAALCGIAFASMLLFVQAGVYVGFLDAAAGLITHIGGDIWVMRRGTQAIDVAHTMPPEVRTVVMSQPCVLSARPVFVTYMPFRSVSGQSGSILLVGMHISERQSGPGLVPWSVLQGLPRDLRGPRRFTLDESILGRLHIPLHSALGLELEIAGRSARLVAITRGVRSFSTAPIAFMELSELQEIEGTPDGTARFWVLELEHPACAAEVIRRIGSMPMLQAMTTADFRQTAESYWIGGTGAGALLAFSSVLGFVVGALIVAQTLFNLTQDHLRQLGTLKALGALSREIVLFVAWQALALAGVGAGVGAALAAAVSSASTVLAITLSPSVWLMGVSAVGLMCTLACASSIHKVLTLEPAEVFR